MSAPLDSEKKPGPGGLIRIARAFRYSFAGLGAAFRNEAAFRQEVLLALVLLPLAVWVGDSAVEIAVLWVSVFLVLMVELVNSGIEAVVDRISQERHPLAGRAKDIGSAAVFVSLVNLIAVWLIILIA